MAQTTQPARQAQRSPQPAAAATGTEDHVYGLVSVLYHALQGAQTCEQYIEDASEANDEELVKFFEQCRDQQQELGRRAKRLLVDRAELEDEDEEEDEDEDEDEDDEE